jgi:hypothetical protein
VAQSSARSANMAAPIAREAIDAFFTARAMYIHIRTLMHIKGDMMCSMMLCIPVPMCIPVLTTHVKAHHCQI